MKGLIYKSTGSWYLVKDEEGTFYEARLKGIFKIDGITSTNPIAVGDQVELEFSNEGETMIRNILPRHNYIARSSPHHISQHHIIAANLDQAILFSSLKNPKTSLGFIDRFLATAEAFHIPAVIFFNKSDLYQKKEMQQYQHIEKMYGSLGYPVLLMSVSGLSGIEETKKFFENKTSLISGNSGVGKSSFINYLAPGLNLKTLEVSQWSGKGMHTTTFAEMHDIQGFQNAKIIDTPGLREFGMADMDKQEISHYFPEMRNRLQDCRFNNCLHIDEPGCAIKDAVEKEEIYMDRYVSYLKIMDSINKKAY
ncbi:MAG: ribosome small subunit-dependent GTPase A [Bacteroidetes bacterium]|nr:ribosome small subunit-dependent GTPase A [Bacteroidota bacterium]